MIAASAADVPALPPPVVLRGLLSDADVKAVLSYANQLNLDDGEGWIRYDSTHEVTYLHHGGEMHDGVYRTFQHGCAALHERMQSEVRLRAHDAGLCQLSEHLNIRCIELHTYQGGGGLTDPGHFDDGSTLTASVALALPASGGLFTTTDASGVVTTHVLAAGDAIVLHSHNLHNVTEVESGTRKSLVVELWRHKENRHDRFR